MSFALIFPGQGSQSVGMGRALYDAFPESRSVFEEVDAALGEKLSQVIFEGPEDALTRTANAQPAIMAVSLAAFRALEARGFDAARAAFVAGHSLGEYSALAAAGTFSVGETARLLRIRGEAMQKAVPVGEGAMAAILGLEAEAVAALCAEAEREGGICQPANDNGGGQIVVSGSAEAVARAVALAPERGAKRAIPLAVSAPFHCRLMQPAAEAMAEALAGAEMRAPRVPLVANVTASALTDPAEIRARLVEQVTGQVRWRESVEFMARSGVETLVEIGNGKVLAGLAKRIEKALKVVNVGLPAEVESAEAAIGR
ncbi:malonyl CoA-acyl carrier protein transacylase [Aureimonas endophytica]|uniref:Malonyl CoA-acyl carrier protein transacylase n=1 Tax=Aureimonas endophytica TaxID=2027858 RepID=A0A916ZB32_9HYPH|nr:ACP S-malonyltransferase [Aureimonas endophytica]GGD85591.1 malonyl CoA-acyl carrier protein transacylase [Aureimonas endophytica]